MSADDKVIPRNVTAIIIAAAPGSGKQGTENRVCGLQKQQMRLAPDSERQIGDHRVKHQHARRRAADPVCIHLFDHAVLDQEIRAVGIKTPA